MTRAIPLLLVLGFLIYCLVDCLQTPEDRVRNLPKVVWVLIILIIPVVGGLAWLLAGRAVSGGSTGRGGGGFRPGPRPSGGGGRPIAPDDDDDFLRGLG